MKWLLYLLPICAFGYPSPTMYVSSSGDNSTGRSWATAFTTMAAAEAAATNDEVIVVEGGWYNQAVTDNTTAHKKQVTIYGSQEAGHNSLVTFCGAHFFATPTSGPFSTLANCALRTTNNSDNITLNDGWNFTNVQFGPVTGTVRVSLNGPSEHWFDHCSFYPNINTNVSINAWFKHAGGTGSTNHLSFCEVMPGAQAVFEGTYSADLWTYYNCLFLSPVETHNSYAIESATSGGSVYVTNSVVYGAQGSTAIPNVWVDHSEYGVQETTANSPLRFSQSGYGAGGEFGCLTNIPPDFTMGTNLFGKLFLRIDDAGNGSNAVISAEILNPEGVINWYTQLNTNSNDTIKAKLDDTIYLARKLINMGNEVGCHTRSHSPATPTGLIQISATGTTPRFTVATTRVGDSTNWDGTLTVTINGVSTNLNLIPTNYNNVANLVLKLNGKSLGDGVITVSKSNGTGNPPADSANAVLLADVSNVDISSPYFALFDVGAWATNEIQEAVADLQSYIRYGYDRNGLNPVSNSAEMTATTSNYVVKTFCAPYFLFAPWAVWGCTNSGVICAWQASQNSTRPVIYDRGLPVDRYGFSVLATDGSAAYSAAGQSLFAKAAAGASWEAYLCHGLLVYGGTDLAAVTNLHTLCQRYHLGGETFGGAMQRLLNDTANWSAGVTNLTFIGDYQNFVKPSFYSQFQPGSAVAAMGFQPITIGTVTPADYLALQTVPNFRVNTQLPLLTRWGYSPDSNTLVQLAKNWGYALMLGGGGTYTDPTQVSNALQSGTTENGFILLASNNPSVYKLGVLIDRTFYNPPDGLYCTNAAGQFVDNNGGNTKVVSPESPDSYWTLSSETWVTNLSILQTNAPIAIVLNGGEYGLDVAGVATNAWRQDPRVIAATNVTRYNSMGPTMARYSADRKAHQLGFLTSSIKQHLPNRQLYIFYNTGNEQNRYTALGDINSWLNNYAFWGWNSDVLSTNTDLPSFENYYAGTWGYITNPFPNDLLSRETAGVGRNMALGYTNHYDWVSGGWDNGNGFTDPNSYSGFLKCLYTSGMVGAIAGYFSSPNGGFSAPFDISTPPSWLSQMTTLAHVHALFSHLDYFLYSGDLVSGQQTHLMVSDQPAYEFTNTLADATARVFARKYRNANQWLITAWKQVGSDENVTVSIPTLGTVTVTAANTGAVYYATSPSNLQLLDEYGSFPTPTIGASTINLGVGTAIFR